MMTPEQIKARRRLLVKRNAARKSRETWKRKRGRASPDVSNPPDSHSGVPETDAVLDELPDSLIG